MKKIILLLSLGINCAFAQENFKYYLPQKVIAVEVPITKITKSIGDCYGFDIEILVKKGIDKNNLKDFMDNNGNPKYDSCKTQINRQKSVDSLKEKKGLGFDLETFKINDSDIAIKTRPIKDPKKEYTLNFEKKWMKKIGFGISLNPFAIPVTTETTFENKTFEIISTGLITFAKIALGAKNMSPQIDKKLDGCDCGRKWLLLQEYYAARKATIINQSLSSAEAMKARLEILDNEIEKLEGVFSYSVEKQSAVLYRELLFDSNNVKISQKIFAIDSGKIYFHKKDKVDYITNPDFLPLGITTDTSLKGVIYSLKMEEYKSNPNLKTITPPLSNSIAFNIPSVYRATLSKESTRKTEIREEEILMPQFGSVGSIPYNLNKTKVEYDENGSIKSLAIESEAILSTDKISTLGDTIEKFKKEPAKSEDEKLVESLEQEKKVTTLKKDILEAKKKIEELEKATNVKQQE